MSKHDELHEEKQPRQEGQKVAQHIEIEVRVRRPRCDCPIYEWDRELECMRLSGVYRAEPGLPADLATLRLEEQLDVPVLLLTTYSSPPETIVRARLIGALHYILGLYRRHLGRYIPIRLLLARNATRLTTCFPEGICANNRRRGVAAGCCND